jgi:hypothetical protein
METLTPFKVPLLVMAITAGACFTIGGGIDLIRRKNNPVLMGAYVAGGSALALVALALLTGWRPLGPVAEYGPADPAAPMISELMDEIRQMEHTS